MPAGALKNRRPRFSHKITLLTTNNKKFIIGHNTSPVTKLKKKLDPKKKKKNHAFLVSKVYHATSKMVCPMITPMYYV